MAAESIPERLELTVEIEDSSISRCQLQDKRWLDATLRESLGKANVVILPWENFRELDVPVFPVGTADFYQAIRVSAISELVPELAVVDAQYSEVALHADLVITPTLFVTSFVAPVITKFVADWLARSLLERAKNSDVKFQMYIEDVHGKTNSFESLIGAQLLKESSLVPKAAGDEGTSPKENTIDCTVGGDNIE